MTHTTNFDINKDGSITDVDIEQTDKINEIELREQKATTQKLMAWTSIISMVGLTAVLFSPLVSDTRVHALGSILDVFFIAQAGVVGAYMGVTAWMSRDKS